MQGSVGGNMILTVTLNPAVDKVYKVANFCIGEVFRAEEVLTTAGGKGINVARVCSILGEDVIATGFLGGNTGAFIREGLKAHNIVDAFIAIPGETRTSITVDDLIYGHSTQILEDGPIIPNDIQQEFVASFGTLVEISDIVVLAGSLPIGLETDFYGRLIDIVHAKGKKVILDTSGEALRLGMAHVPFMIKPNLPELRVLIGSGLMDEEDIAYEALNINHSGIDLVCITLGRDGAIVAYNGDIFRLIAPPIETVNTVGCGDAFVAGCAIGHMRKYDIESTLKYAMACGIANTQFSEPGRVDEGLVTKFFDSISIWKNTYGLKSMIKGI